VPLLLTTPADEAAGCATESPNAIGVDDDDRSAIESLGSPPRSEGFDRQLPLMLSRFRGEGREEREHSNLLFRNILFANVQARQSQSREGLRYVAPLGVMETVKSPILLPASDQGIMETVT